MKNELTGIGTTLLVLLLLAQSLDAQDVLPFPPPPMGGKAGATMQQSVHQWREQARLLPAGAPNILIVMLDDAGFGQARTFGGEVNTPALSRLASQGITIEGGAGNGTPRGTRSVRIPGFRWSPGLIRRAVVTNNAFHATAMSSPTRAALWSSLHRCADWSQRVGNRT